MPENFANFLSANLWILLLAAAWTIPWKGVALWRAARNQSLAWFVIFLIINTLGILEIIYIFIISRGRKVQQEIEEPVAQVTERKVLDIKTEMKSDLDEQAKKV